MEDSTAANSLHIVNSKEEMELEMMKVNKEKYTGIYDTPPLIKPLKSILGLYGLTQNCDLILQGT